MTVHTFAVTVHTYTCSDGAYNYSDGAYSCDDGAYGCDDGAYFATGLPRKLTHRTTNSQCVSFMKPAISGIHLCCRVCKLARRTYYKHIDIWLKLPRSETAVESIRWDVLPSLHSAQQTIKLCSMISFKT